MTAKHILVVDDEPEIRSSVRDILEDEGFVVSVAESAAEARKRRELKAPDLVFLDIWMPGEDGVSLLKDWKETEGLSFPVVMMSGHGTVETAVEATRLGAFDFIEKPLSLAKLLRVASQALAMSQDSAAAQSLPTSIPLLEPVGESQVMQSLRDECQRAAQHSTPVMLLGEQGAGKTFIARYIHALGLRSSHPFVEVSASTLNEDGVMEALFGQEGGDRTGLLEQAGQGTIFLREIGDLEMGAQTALLSVLEQGSYTRVGGNKKLKMEARVVVSTQYDLLERGRDGLFREDLFYNLNVLPIQVKPVREHAEDIPDLLKFFVDYFNAQENLPYRHFTLAAQNYLRYYSWPGNIRQVRNMVQRLLILGEETEVSQTEVEEVLVRDRVAQAEMTAGLPQEVMELPLRDAREIFEREYLSRQLELCKGNVSRLAERVGMERTH
ncbi:MAG TPA: sigma-54-dependent Fis family transcriptional regulator, partial [Gammaproteobacteria bacterium]|nr:sigma-54-dependent Fis family transcriptional regulator [Gammaproteobacteria bacterium]